MIKRLLSLLACTMLVIAFAASCSEGGSTDNPGDKPTPEPTPEPTPTEAFNPYPDAPTPLKVFANKVEATDEGVSVEVTKIENNNFVFSLRPGDFVQSYRMDVFPLCRLYNSLFEDMKKAGKTTATERDIDTWIRSYVFNSQGAGAFTFDPQTHADYADKEFDWMNTTYAQAHIVPDAEYIIVAIACFDAEGTEDGEMSLCYVRTSSEELIGDPQVQIEVQVNYRAMQVTHHPNADCKYLYYYASDEADLMPFINAYGDKLYSDFMRHTIGDATSAEDEDALWYYRDFGQSANASSPIMATAIALDENQTPAENFNSQVFTLKPIPEDMEMGSGTIKAVEGKVGASYLWYEYTIAPNTPVVLWKLFTPEEAEYYMTKASEQELRELALLIDNDGWGLVNKNYEYNEQTNTYGEGYTGREILYATPDTDHIFGYVARNRAGVLSDVVFTDVIHTKPLIMDKPEECQSDCVMTLTTIDRTKFNIRFDYDFEKHAGVRFQYLEPVLQDGTQIPLDSSREEYLKFFGYIPANTPEEAAVVNNWHGEQRGVDSWNYVDEPGTTYKFAAMFEDWNGVVSDVVFGEVSTLAINPGDNPKVEITAKNENGVVTYTFTCNEDTAYMHYMTGSITDSDDYLHLGDLGTDKYTPGEYISLWRSQCMDLALPTQSLSTTLNISSQVVSIALCIPFGKDDCRGDLAYLIWDGKEAKTLTDYYPDYQPSTSAATLQMAPARKSNAIHASELRNPRGEEGDVEVRYMMLNMQRLASHPHATNN